MSPWKAKPTPRQSSKTTRETSEGLEVVSNRPHDLLLASPRIPTLQEQVQSLTRLSAIQRTSALENLPDHYFAEEIEDDIYSEGTTPYELEGSRDYWDEQSVKAQHKVPDPVNGGTEQPKGQTKDENP